MRGSLLLAALALGGVPAVASAQLEFPVLLVEVNGETSSTELGRPFNAAHCADPSAVSVTLSAGSGMATASGSLDMWIGRSSTACETGSNRNVNPTDSTCEHLGTTPTPVNPDREVAMTFADMLGATIDPCANTSSTGAQFRLYLFNTTESPYLTDPVGVNWGYLGGSKTGTGQFVVDTQAPAPPAVDSTTVVGQRPTVSWDIPAGMETELTYRAYVDFSGTGCGGTPMDGGGGMDAGGDGGLDGGLDGGADAGPSSPVPAYDQMYEFEGTSRTSATIPLDELGLTAGAVVTIYMTVLDFALNESAPSQAICATYQPTGDFCTISGTCGDLCNCSAPGTPGRPPLALLVALPLVGLWFARRRRTR